MLLIKNGNNFSCINFLSVMEKSTGKYKGDYQFVK